LFPVYSSVGGCRFDTVFRPSFYQPATRAKADSASGQPKRVPKPKTTTAAKGLQKGKRPPATTDHEAHDDTNEDEADSDADVATRSDEDEEAHEEGMFFCIATVTFEFLKLETAC
jgi:hypothetical protein